MGKFDIWTLSASYSAYPFKPDFLQILEICSYCLKFSLKSKFKFLLFSRKYRQKNFACGAKFTRLYLCIPSKFRFPSKSIIFFACGAKFPLYALKIPQIPLKIFACGAKWTTFWVYALIFWKYLSSSSYCLKFSSNSWNPSS